MKYFIYVISKIAWLNDLKGAIFFVHTAVHALSRYISTESNFEAILKLLLPAQYKSEILNIKTRCVISVVRGIRFGLFCDDWFESLPRHFIFIFLSTNFS